MSKNTVIKAAVLAASLALLSGCSTYDDVSNIVGSWFGPSDQNKLRGERIPLAALDGSLQPDATIQNDPVVLPAPWRNETWPQPGGGSSNAMYHLDARGPLRQIWDVSAGKGSDSKSRITAAPVVGGGRIYSLDAEAHVYVFNAKTGAPVWDKRLAPKNGTDMPTLWGLLGKPNTIEPVTGMGGGVAFNAGRLYVTSGFGVALALDAATGKEIWHNDLGRPIVNAPVVSGGRIFVSTDDNQMHALAEADGRMLWEHQGITETAGILSSTSAAVAGETVIVPYSSGEIYALRAQTGTVNWSEVLSHSGQVTALSELDDIAGRPVIDRGQVYAISHSGVLTAINLSTGDRLWTRDIGGTQTPWAAGDYVYVLTGQQQLICLTRKEGKVRWIHQLPAYTDPGYRNHPIEWTGPVLVTDKLLVLSSEGYAEAISPYTGSVMGRVETEGGTSIAPIVADEIVYYYTNGGDLVALR